MRVRRNLQLYEALYLAIGMALCACLLSRSGGLTVTVVVAFCTVVYAIFLGNSKPGSVPRLIGAYLATWALYAGSSRLVEVLRVPLQNERLLFLDEMFFSQSPAQTLRGVFSGWQMEVIALAYMSYHLYLHWVLIDALFRKRTWRLELSNWIFLAFGAGFVGYFLFPAACPVAAFPEMFNQPQAGGVFSRWNAAINARLGARYDAFPSLHTLITLTMLAWDWRHLRLRFWIMLLPSALMLVATLALQLHYAMDLVASGLLFVLLMSFHARFTRRES